MDANGSPKTLQQAILYYSDPKVCEDLLVAARWPRGVQCPHCGSVKVRRLETQKRWECSEKHARRQFSVKIGTIFEDSPISLSKWFVAIWLLSAAKNGISSYELHRAIGVTQKTAWFILHRVRLAMQTRSFEKKFEGHVEADETFIGGRARNMHAWRKALVLKGRQSGVTGKTAVMGVLDRRGPDGHSIVSTIVVPTTRRHELQQHLRRVVNMDGETTLYTDALKSYEPKTPKGWRPSDLYIHKVIDHAKAYVDGQIHTNGMENYWSLLKRTIKGTYVSVEPFHLFRYLDEQAFRFNSRKQSDSDRFLDMTERVSGKRLTYKELIGERLEQSA
jgi:transposase-like protein